MTKEDVTAVNAELALKALERRERLIQQAKVGTPRHTNMAQGYFRAFINLAIYASVCGVTWLCLGSFLPGGEIERDPTQVVVALGITFTWILHESATSHAAMINSNRRVDALVELLEVAKLWQKQPDDQNS